MEKTRISSLTSSSIHIFAIKDNYVIIKRNAGLMKTQNIMKFEIKVNDDKQRFLRGWTTLVKFIEPFEPVTTKYKKSSLIAFQKNKNYWLTSTLADWKHKRAHCL